MYRVMSEIGVYEAATAAFITGVAPETQREWRRRGFLPSHDGRHARFTVRDLCRLRLMRALVETGFPVSQAIRLVCEDFLDSLQAEVLAVAEPAYVNGFLAIIAWNGDDIFHVVAWSMNDVAALEKSSGFDFSSFHVIRLQQIAKDLVARGIFDHPGQRER